MTDCNPALDQSAAAVTADLDRMLKEALQAHQQDRLIDAEQLYLRILAIEPAQPDALHNMGLLQMQCSNPLAALPWFKAALEAQPGNPQCWHSYAEAFLEADQADEARQVILAGRAAGWEGNELDLLELRVTTAWIRKPDLASLRVLGENGQFGVLADQALSQIEQFGEKTELLGLYAEALLHLGHEVQALPWLEKLCVATPEIYEAWMMWGMALTRLKRYEDAYRVYLKALAIWPEDVRLLQSLGNNLSEAGYADEATVWLRLGLALDESNWPVRLDLARAWLALGNQPAAREVIEAAGVNEDWPEEATLLYAELTETQLSTKEKKRRVVGKAASAAERNHVMDLYTHNRPEELASAARDLCERFPLDAFVWKTLGVALKLLKNQEQALTAMRLAAAAGHNDLEAYCNLSALLNELGRGSEAEGYARRALDMHPDNVDALLQLGSALLKQNRRDAAEECWRRVLTLNPHEDRLMAYFQFQINHDDNVSPDENLRKAKVYGRSIQVRDRERYISWQCEPDPKRLRVGFVSGDLRHHVVAFYLESFLPHISKERLELYAYHTQSAEDEVTEKLRTHFFKWTSLVDVGDAAAAHLIHHDKIHVLIDLSGFTAHHRLPVFARKPAPVQASWLGYFATTGVPQIDYFIGDPYLAPPSEDRFFVEKLWRLPDVVCSSIPPDLLLGEEIAVKPLPALTNGYVTFGSFNKLAKISYSTIATWAKILNAVGGARLLLNAPELERDASRSDILNKFDQCKVDPSRLILMDWRRSRKEHLELYAQVDIALDPFPYCGGTTTIEALWMGVPVLTLRGDRYLSRLGETLVSNATLAEWVADSTDDYVKKAVYFSDNLDPLNALRGRLRGQVLKSPVFDGKRFAKNYEEAVFGMWRRRGAKQYLSTASS